MVEFFVGLSFCCSGVFGDFVYCGLDDFDPCDCEKLLGDDTFSSLFFLLSSILCVFRSSGGIL